MTPEQFHIQSPDPMSNASRDNAFGELIVHRGLNVRDGWGRVFMFDGYLGSGEFGHVYRVIHTNPKDGVLQCYAVKISRSDPNAIERFQYESDLFTYLHGQSPDISSYYSSFLYQSHRCIVLDLLGQSLLQRIEASAYTGLPLSEVRTILFQLLQTLAHLHSLNIVHLDGKPENILVENDRSDRVRLIDFGGSCVVGDPAFTYVQTRYYRSPEVVLGMPIGTPADIWSLGCVAAELLLGLPIMPGTSEPHLLALMRERLGQFPEALQNAQDMAQQELALGDVFEKAERYFRFEKLDDIIMEYSPKQRIPPSEMKSFPEQKHKFLDLLHRMLEYEPEKRITAAEAMNHSFFQFTSEDAVSSQAGLMDGSDAAQ
jgi:serine/threonine protein kinase